MEENNKAHFNLDELIKDQPKKSKKKSRKDDDEELNGGKKVDDFKVIIRSLKFIEIEFFLNFELKF